MPDIYNVNSRNIVGGPGRLVVKAFDGTYPEAIEDVMQGPEAGYELTAGWRDIGATTDGINVSRGFDTEDFSVDQVNGVVDTDITDWTHTLETSMAENTVTNRQLALVGGTIIETAPTFGTETTTTGALAQGATIVNLTSSAEFVAGGYANIDGVNYRIESVTANSIVVSPGMVAAVDAAAVARPVTALGSRRIGYGTVDDVPFMTYALISQKKDKTLYMQVIRKAKVSGDDKTQTFGKEKRTLPLALNAYPDDAAAKEENVYYEIEQVIN